MVHYDKRDKLIVNEREYIVLRVLRPRAAWENYLVSDGSKQFLMNVFPIDEKPEVIDIIEKKVSSYNKLKEIGIPMTELVSCDKKKGIVIREYKEGTPASLMLLRGELSVDYLIQVRDMAKLVESKGYVLDYFPAEYICDKDKCYYIKHELEEYSEEKAFDSVAGKFWMSVIDVSDK